LAFECGDNVTGDDARRFNIARGCRSYAWGQRGRDEKKKEAPDRRFLFDVIDATS
jgi:hypothetical protein